MHTEVFSNIDLLIEMADSNFNIDEINTELITLKRSIRNKKNEIDDLKSIMIDTRYFNASNELVDKNIEISLKNKINRLEKKLRNMQEAQDTTLQDEEKMHNDISSLKSKLTKNEKYVLVLKEKNSTSTNNNYYNELLQEEEENVKKLEELLAKKEKKHESILKEIELNNQAIKELNIKLEAEKNRLNDILDSLNNPNAYLDEELKKEDEEKLNSLNSELEKLEKRRIELLTDASMIGADAKELILDNNYMGALTKIKELVTIVKAKPYMDITNNTVLNEELEKKETLRSELSNLIDNKSYEGINSDAITKRIEYLNSEIANNEEEIVKYKASITSIDDEINTNLADLIKNLEAEVNKKESILDEYEEMLKDEKTSLRTKANLESAIGKKEKEKKILDGLLVSYKDSLLSKIAKTNTLNDIVNKLQSEINKFKQEKENLNKLTMLDLSTKDLLKEEKDKEDLRKVNEEIKAIKNRQKYDKNPNEIYDQIEMLLASFNHEEENPVVEVKEEPKVEIDSLFTEEQPKLKVVDMIPVETNYAGVVGDNNGN